MQILGMLEQSSLAKWGNQVLSKLPHLPFEAFEECDAKHQMLEKKCGKPFWRLSAWCINQSSSLHS